MDDTEKKDSSNAEATEDKEQAEKAAEESKDSASEAKESEEKAEEADDKAEDSAEEAKESEEKAEKAEEKAEEATQEAREESKEEPKKEIKVSGKLADIIKDIEELSVMELSDLVKALEEKFGVSAAAPVAVAGAASAAGSGEEEQEEGQTSFNVMLTDGGANKISVIKAVRELVPTLGLKESKDLVDGAPKQVLEGVGKDAAAEAKKKLEDAGGKVELK